MKGKTLCEVFGYLKPNSMKTGKRSVPLDSLSVSEDRVSVSIHTHRNSMCMNVNDGSQELRLICSFDHFCDMVITYMENDSRTERSRSTGVEGGK